MSDAEERIDELVGLDLGHREEGGHVVDSHGVERVNVQAVGLTFGRRGETGELHDAVLGDLQHVERELKFESVLLRAHIERRTGAGEEGPGLHGSRENQAARDLAAVVFQCLAQGGGFAALFAGNSVPAYDAILLTVFAKFANPHRRRRE